MKMFRKLACVLCAAALMLSFAACGQTASQTASESSAPGTEITPAPEPTAAPEEDGQDMIPTPAPEGDEAEESHHSVLPAPENGSEAFRAAFETNPVDAQYASDLETAGSVANIIAACNTASERWQEQIDSVYAQILERGDDKTVEQVTEDQSHWINEQSNELQAIRDSVSEDDPLAAITVAESIMLYYRTRAIDLCAALYEIDGKLVFG
ncbi:MAG: hypothetical protein ACI4GO_08795 [Hominenteromicrobium sp.]